MKRVPYLKLIRSGESDVRSFIAPVELRLQQSYMALADMKEMLFEKERESVTTNKEIARLTDENSRLQQSLNLLTKKEARSHHFAYHDALTGLPNRRLLFDRINRAIALAARQSRRLVLLFFDIDDFKNINDQRGHIAGDQILQEVAKRLQYGLRSADTASRYGGDEFIILLPEVDGAEHVWVVEQKLRALLHQPYMVDGSALSISISIGCAAYPSDGKNLSELIERADGDMYHAKASGIAPIPH